MSSSRKNKEKRTDSIGWGRRYLFFSMYSQINQVFVCVRGRRVFVKLRPVASCDACLQYKRKKKARGVGGGCKCCFLKVPLCYNHVARCVVILHACTICRCAYHMYVCVRTPCCRRHIGSLIVAHHKDNNIKKKM